MSTAVLFVEFIMMSLMGIMLYRLYTSYKAWKVTSVFSTPTGAFDNSLECSQLNAEAESLAAGEIHISEPAAIQYEVKAPVQEVVEASQIAENKPSSILNDYIGEFFSEPQVMNIEPFRALDSKSVSSVEKSVEQKLKPVLISSGLKASNTEDDIIKVETAAKDIADIDQVTVSNDAIPTLKEFSDVEPDSFITVASAKHNAQNSNKVMSDKVVMAMLDEAKIVCAS